MGLISALKAETVALMGEFCGTFLFLFIAFMATQTASALSGTTTTVQSLTFISLAFGFSLAVNAWTFFRISGGLFNPAVTLSLTLVGAVKPLRGIGIFGAQIVGGIAAAGVVKGLLPGHPTLLFKTTLTAGMTNAQGLFLEMFVTANLVVTILFLAAEKHKATFIAPVGIGLALFISELASVYYTGGSLNPARSFGPCVVDGDFPSYHWIYWIGPLLGSLLATAFYGINKKLDYENANPGQDKSLDPELSPANMDRIISQSEAKQSGSGRRSSSMNRGPTYADGNSRYSQQQYGYQAPPQAQPQQAYPQQPYPPQAPPPQNYQQYANPHMQQEPARHSSRRHSRESSTGRQPRRNEILNGMR